MLALLCATGSLGMDVVEMVLPNGTKVVIEAEGEAVDVKDAAGRALPEDDAELKNLLNWAISEFLLLMQCHTSCIHDNQLPKFKTTIRYSNQTHWKAWDYREQAHVFPRLLLSEPCTKFYSGDYFHHLHVAQLVPCSILGSPSGHSDPGELKRQASAGTSKEAIERRQQVQEVWCDMHGLTTHWPCGLSSACIIPCESHLLRPRCSIVTLHQLLLQRSSLQSGHGAML